MIPCIVDRKGPNITTVPRSAESAFPSPTGLSSGRYTQRAETELQTEGSIHTALPRHRLLRLAKKPSPDRLQKRSGQ